MSSRMPLHLRRFDGLDAARGLAVLGMFVAHVASSAHGSFDWTRPDSWLDVVNGRSALLFALCAGVSLTLSTRPRDRDQDSPIARRRSVLARAVALFVLGALLQSLASGVAVILQTYAVCFVASLPLLRARVRVIGLVIAACLVGGPPLALVGQSFAQDGGDAIIAGVLFGAYPAVTWWAVVLTGVLLGRLDLSSTRTQSVLLGAGAVAGMVGYGGGALLRMALGLVPVSSLTGNVGTASPGRQGGGPSTDAGPLVTQQGGGSPEHPEVDWSLLTAITPHAGSAFEVVGGVGIGLTVLAVMLVVTPHLGRLLFPIVSVGRLALTIYSAHIVVLVLRGSGGDSATPDAGGEWAPWVLLAAMVLGSLTVAPIWCRLAGRGPLERLIGRCSRALDDPNPSIATTR